MQTLMYDFDLVALDNIEVTTMNGHCARGFQWFAQTRTRVRCMESPQDATEATEAQAVIGFHPRALTEIERARDWCEERRPARGRAVIRAAYRRHRRARLV
jgi:hypothetical protein